MNLTLNILAGYPSFDLLCMQLCLGVAVMLCYADENETAKIPTV